jgi:hypothetical protein
MTMPQKKRSSYLSTRDLPLGIGKAVTIWGYGKAGQFVCRLEISSAGIDVYSGPKGKKLLQKLNWEGVVDALG